MEGRSSKRGWISEKEMTEFDHITGDQIRGITDVKKLRKLQRYMREEGFPQTAEAVEDAILKLGGRVHRPGDPRYELDEQDEEFDAFLKGFDLWKDSIKHADDKLRELQKEKTGNALATRGQARKCSSDEGNLPSIRPSISFASTDSEVKKPKKDVRSGREYYEHWDAFAAQWEKEEENKKETRDQKAKPVAASEKVKRKERTSIRSKSTTERRWLADREREKGNDLFKAKEYTAALDAYSLSLELFPDSAAAYSNRAAVCIKMNRWEEAHADCCSALHVDPNYVKALMRRGLADLEMFKPREALKDLSAALDLDPSNAEILALKQRAERAYLKQQQEDGKEVKSKRISIQEVEGKEEPASKASTALLELEKGPEVRTGAHQPMICTSSAKRTMLIEEVETSSPARKGKALVEEFEDTSSIEKKEAMIEEVKPQVESVVKSEKASPPEEEFPYVPMRVGPMVIEEVEETPSKSTEESGQTKKPRSPKHGLDENEEEAERERMKGNEEYKRGNYSAAVKFYNKSLSLDPEVAATYANRALCHLKMKDWAAAKADCTEALKMDAGYAKAYYRRGLALEGMGELRGALKDVQVALKILANDEELLEKLKSIKRKLRVAFVKEVTKEEAENQKKLEEACKSPSMDELKTRLSEAATITPGRPATKKENPFKSRNKDEAKEAPAPTKNFKFKKSNAAAAAAAAHVPVKPKTTIEFQRSCEKLQDQPELLKKFIASIPVNDYPRIFKESLSTDALRILLKSLQAVFMPHDPAGTMAVLTGLVKVKRFGLILKLLSATEKSSFLSIFDWLHECCHEPFDRTEELKSMFF